MDWKKKIKKERFSDISIQVVLLVLILSAPFLGILAINFLPIQPVNPESTINIVSSGHIEWILGLSIISLICSFVFGIYTSWSRIRDFKRQSFRDIDIFFKRINDCSNEKDILDIYEQIAIEIEFGTLDYTALYAMCGYKITDLKCSLKQFNQESYKNLRQLIRRMEKS